MSSDTNQPPPSLLDAAKAVLAAWRDYLGDDGQLMPARLLDEPELMDRLEAAIEGEESIREMTSRVMGLVVPFLKDSARLSSDAQIHFVIGACEQLQYEATTTEGKS